MNRKTQYVQSFVREHIQRYFSEYAYETYVNTSIRWTPWNDIQANDHAKYHITIPYDIPLDKQTNEVRIINFNNTKLKIFGKIRLPSISKTNEIWEELSSGSQVMNCNFIDRIWDLLFRVEEKNIPHRDKHNRFLAEYSPRNQFGLLDTPEVNNLIALLVERCVELNNKHKSKSINYKSIVKPVTVCLSHDIDQLTGNDFISQSIRLYRAINYLSKNKLKAKSYLNSFIYNYKHPFEFYWFDLEKMHRLEAQYGFRSINYILCGNMGRFGRRTPNRIIRQYLEDNGGDIEIGMHYNYDTTYDKRLFLKQKEFLEYHLGRSITCGRAHYLRFDTEKSLDMWSSCGIIVDESVGYPDAIGYRSGIAGVFGNQIENNDDTNSIKTLPLIAMDGCLGTKYGKRSVGVIENHVRHLSIVGGTFTLLFHPGRHQNPENLDTYGMYEKLLQVFKRHKAISVLPKEL